MSNGTMGGAAPSGGSLWVFPGMVASESLAVGLTIFL